MYNVNDVVTDGVRIKNLFSHQDEQWHTTYLRPIGGLFTMDRVQDMEPNVDVTISLFLDKMQERFINPSKPCEMSDYINFCMFFPSLADVSCVFLLMLTLYFL